MKTMTNTTGYYDETWPDVPLREVIHAKHYQLPVAINSYTEALGWWNTKSAWGSGAKPIGKSDNYNYTMEMKPDGTIAFDYYKRGEHIRWHKDNTLTVEPMQTYSSTIDRFLMPRSIEIDSGARTGKILKLGDGIGLRVMIESIHGKRYVTNPDVLVVRAEDPITLHFDKDEQRWLPLNEYKLKPFYWYELDKGRLREASKQYNIPEFLAAIETALIMGADIKTGDFQYGDMSTRQVASGEDILTLLEQERYVEAASLVRGIKDQHYDAALQKWVTDEKHLAGTDIRKIRHAAYVEMGLIYLESERIVSLPQFNNIERKLADFGKAE